MSFALLLSVATELLKYAPTVIEAVSAIYTMVTAVRKDVNPDTIIRSDVAARITHVNTIASLIANASGDSINIPLVLVPADFDAWQKVIGPYIKNWQTNVVVPRYVTPLTRLLMRIPNQTGGTKVSVSSILGYNDTYLRAAINALEDAGERDKAVSDYNSIVTFLNTYASVFTSWQGHGEDTLRTMIEVNDPAYVNEESWMGKETLIDTIAQAKLGFLASLPTQAISGDGAAFVWNPKTWVQGATDSNFIFCESIQNMDNVVTNKVGDINYVDLYLSGLIRRDSVPYKTLIDGYPDPLPASVDAKKNGIFQNGYALVSNTNPVCISDQQPADILVT